MTSGQLTSSSQNRLGPSVYLWNSGLRWGAGQDAETGDRRENSRKSVEIQERSRNRVTHRDPGLFFQLLMFWFPRTSFLSDRSGGQINVWKSFKKIWYNLSSLIIQIPVFQILHVDYKQSFTDTFYLSLYSCLESCFLGLEILIFKWISLKLPHRRNGLSCGEKWKCFRLY